LQSEGDSRRQSYVDKNPQKDEQQRWALKYSAPGGRGTCLRRAFRIRQGCVSGVAHEEGVLGFDTRERGAENMAAALFLHKSHNAQVFALPRGIQLQV